MSPVIPGLTKEYLHCEDTQACLVTLGNAIDIGEQKLRNSNREQQLCLKADDASSISLECQQFRQCLSNTSPSHEDNLIDLLDAVLEQKWEPPDAFTTTTTIATTTAVLLQTLDI